MPPAVRAAYHEIIEDVKRNRPDAHIDGIAIQPMVRQAQWPRIDGRRHQRPGVRPGDHLRRRRHHGGSPGRPRRCAAPAEQFPGARTDQWHAHRQNCSAPSATCHRSQMEALESVLLRVSEMVCELPLAEGNGHQSADRGRARRAGRRCARGGGIPPVPADRYAHMAIYPYPTHLVTKWQLPDGTDITIRPIRPEDAEIEQEFVRDLSEEVEIFPLHAQRAGTLRDMLARFTQIDYGREMALIAVTEENGKEVELGVWRYRHQPGRRNLRIRPGGQRPVAAKASARS